MKRFGIICLLLFASVGQIKASELDSLRFLRQALLENKLKQEKLKNLLHEKDTLLLAQFEYKLEQVLANTTGIPVNLDDDTLFYLYRGIGPLNTRERVTRIKERIELLVENTQFSAELLTLEVDDHAYRLIYDAETTVFVLTEEDALLGLLSLKELGESYREAVILAVTQKQAESAWLQWLSKAFLVLLVIGVFAAIIVGINRGYAKIQRNVDHIQSKILTRLRIGNYQLFDEKRASLAMGWLLKAARILL